MDIDKERALAHYTALAGETVKEVVAYRLPGKYGDFVICTDPLCLAAYADELARGIAKPMTQDAISEFQEEREGIAILCDSCAEALDLWTLTNGMLR
jgi:hypothetical protein